MKKTSVLIIILFLCCTNSTEENKALDEVGNKARTDYPKILGYERTYKNEYFFDQEGNRWFCFTEDSVNQILETYKSNLKLKKWGFLNQYNSDSSLIFTFRKADSTCVISTLKDDKLNKINLSIYTPTENKEEKNDD